jgi:beta-glucosidase
MKGRTYRYMRAEPLFPFGFGLSYTTFAYSNLQVSKKKIRRGDSVAASVTLTNTGKYASRSDEVVELYITHENAGDSAALFALKGFRRVSLAPGDSVRLSFVLTPDLLSVVDNKGRQVIPAGKIRLSIAGSLPTRRSEELGAAKGVEAEIEVAAK